jgi:hypothetical protein
LADTSENDVRLYISLVSEGVSDWFVCPLEVLPDRTSWAAIRECEQKWINSFLARAFGFNAINAAAASCDSECFAAGRVYAYRNMARRTFSCWQAHRQGRLRDDNVQQFFAHYTDKNSINMHHFCLVQGPPTQADNAVRDVVFVVVVVVVVVVRDLHQPGSIHRPPW